MEILVVDDSPSVRALLVEVLSDDGYTVSVAANGVEALAIVADIQLSLIILDLQMPLMDGRVFFRALRALPSEVPVLLLTAQGAYAARHELGAEDALAKPFDAERLVHRVQRLVAAV